MNNENEIERIARLICQDESGKCLHDEMTCDNHLECWARNKAQRMIDIGIGDKKQAVKEFAEKLKVRFYNMDYSAIAIDNKIDDLITELYGGEENE